MLDLQPSSRRRLLGLGVLSAAAVGVLAASPAMAAAGDASQGDIDILNVALGLEHEAIEAYQIGAESGLLDKPVVAIAVTFQGQHKGHRDALIAAIQKLGGTPVQAKSRQEYLVAIDAPSLKSQADVLRLAQKLEKGAANAYIGVMPSFSNRDFAQVCGRLAADEATHWALLSNALGDSYPTSAFIFG